MTPARAKNHNGKAYALRLETAKGTINRAQVALKRSRDLLAQSRSALAASRKRPHEFARNQG